MTVTDKDLLKKSFPNMYQIDGDHYVQLKIQPFTYSRINNFNVTQSNIIKYASRLYNHPDGPVSMLEKIKHYCDLEIQHLRESKHDTSD